MNIALQRFIDKCVHCAVSDCVIWQGGTSVGKGNIIPYGVFWFEGKKWYAHRWAAKFIHGLEIEDRHVDHKCTNSLCVHHLQAVEPIVNLRLRWERRVEPEEMFCHPPFYDVPQWMRNHPSPRTSCLVKDHQWVT